MARRSSLSISVSQALKFYAQARMLAVDCEDLVSEMEAATVNVQSGFGSMMVYQEDESDSAGTIASGVLLNLAPAVYASGDYMSIVRADTVPRPITPTPFPSRTRPTRPCTSLPNRSCSNPFLR